MEIKDLAKIITMLIVSIIIVRLITIIIQIILQIFNLKNKSRFWTCLTNAFLMQKS